MLDFSGVSEAAMGAALVGRVDGRPDVVLDHYRGPAGLPPVERVAYSVTAEACPLGDAAVIDVSAVPAEIAHAAEAFEALVNGQVVTLPGGAEPGFRRVVRIPAVGTGLAEIRLRIVWRRLDDRVTNARSSWSGPSYVAGVVDAAAPRLILQADQTTINAGEGVAFSAEVRGAGPLWDTADVHFRWDYGDAGAVHKRQSPEFVAVYGNDANVSFDKLGGHVYETPGLKTVTCTAHARQADGSLVRIDATLDIQVNDLAAVFSGAEGATCIIDNVMGEPWRASGTVFESGNANSALNGLNVFRNIGIALDYYMRAVGGQKSRVRLLLRNGQVHNGVNFNRNGIEVFHVDATDPDGADLPDLDPEFADSSAYVVLISQGQADHGPASVRNVNIPGPYDPSLQAQDRPRDCVGFTVPKLTLHNVGISGWNAGVRPASGQTLIASSVHITDWANYGLLMSPGSSDPELHRLIGCTFAQNPLTLREPEKGETSNVTADHGPYRNSNPEPGLAGSCAFIQCDFASFNNWAGGEAQAQVQLCIRWNAFGLPACVLQVSQCMLEGGSLFIGPTAAPYGSAWADVKVARCVHISAAGGMFGSGFSGAVFENNVGIVADLTEAPPGSYFALSEVHNFGSIGNSADPANDTYVRNRPNKAQCWALPAICRNNTWMDWQLTHRVDFEAFKVTPNTFEDMRVGGNLIHAPNVPEFGAVPDLDLAPSFTPRYQGRRVLSENGGALQPEFSTQAFGILGRPLAGCPAIGAAVGEVALDDFTGTLRRDVLAGLTRNAPSLGAFEPALEA